MKGLSATFWSALGALCQALSSSALARSTTWALRARECFRRAGS